MTPYIFTYGRSARQITWRNLSPALQERAIFVIQERERHMFDARQSIILPDGIRDLPRARQHILDTSPDMKCCMLDDDLVFLKRRLDDRGKFVPATHDDIDRAFAMMAQALDTYAHVGMTGREGGNRHPDSYAIGRMSRVLAYNLPILRQHGVRFDRLLLPEDFDMTLQLLSHGLPNFIVCEYAQGQAGGSNAPGGCSSYRTIAVHNEWMEKFAALHPAFVKLVHKETKGAWGGQPRKDVIVQWRKAYDAGTRSTERHPN